MAPALDPTPLGKETPLPTPVPRRLRRFGPIQNTWLCHCVPLIANEQLAIKATATLAMAKANTSTFEYNIILALVRKAIENKPKAS